MKELKFDYDGSRHSFKGPTHAALFRGFFDWWKTKYPKQTVYGTFESGLRLSDEEYYEGQVIKKKNYHVFGDLYIITHITPAAMDRGIFNFLDAVGAEVVEPKNAKKQNANKTSSNEATVKTTNHKTKTSNEQPEQNENQEPNEETNEQSNPAEQIDENYEKIAEEIKNMAEQITEAKDENDLNMSELIKKKMALRDAEIKARLAKGNRPTNE